MACSIALIILIWAANFVAAKVGVRYLPALTLASFRVTLAAALMLPIYLFLARRLRFQEAAAPGISWRDAWVFLYLGFFGVVVNQVGFTVGLRYTSVSHAAVIVGMGPIYTLTLAVLFGLERADRSKVFGMVIAFAGVAILASDSLRSGNASLLGDAITFSGSLGFAMYVVLAKRVATRYDSLTMTAFNHFAGALVILPIAVHKARLLYLSAGWRAVPWQGWAAVAYMAVFASALAYLVYFWLLRYLSPSELSAFTYALPIVATLIGIVWLGERASWTQAAGGALALVGLYTVEAGRR